MNLNRPADGPEPEAVPGTDPTSHVCVAVVVVLYNSAPLVPGLVQSLPEGLDGVSWRLIAVDNDSTDDGPAVLRRAAPEAIIVETRRNAGYAAGINAGVAAAPPHDAVLVLNPDVRLARGCVRELLGALREPGVGIAVPRLVDAEGQLILSMRREPTLLRAFADALLGASRVGRYSALGEVVTEARAYEAERFTDWAEGSTQLVDAECWRVCGGWDESFFLYSEETDFDLRARDAGFSTKYVPRARAIHLEGGSGASAGLRALMAVNRVRLFRRRNGRLRGTAYWASILLREVSRAAIGDRGSHPTVRALTSPSRFRDAPGPHWL